MAKRSKLCFDNPGKIERIYIRIDADLKERSLLMAARRGLTLSEVIRDTLELLIAEAKQ